MQLLRRRQTCWIMKATLECEQPNANLHKFQGRLMYQSGSEGECPPLALIDFLTRDLTTITSRVVPLIMIRLTI